MLLLATVFVMTMRLALYGASLEPHFRSQPRWFRWAAPQLIVDQTFAVASARTDVDTPATFRRYWLGAGGSLAVMWVGAVGAGILLGPVIPQGTPLEFAPVAVFVSPLVRRLTDRPSAAAAATAGVVAAACGVGGGRATPGLGRARRCAVRGGGRDRNREEKAVTLLVLVAAGIVSWSLRIAFITLVPAARLPEQARVALRHVAPAALAALVVTGLAKQAGSAAQPTSWAPLGAGYPSRLADPQARRDGCGGLGFACGCCASSVPDPKP
ncbi:MAG: AzlC family ABC transporter permease [Frankiaceae bacterium]